MNGWEWLITGMGTPVVILGILRILWHKERGGVYGWRTDKPHAVIGFPMIGRHWAYVGLTNSYYFRGKQHLEGGGRYESRQATWSDLRPKCYRIFPMPPFLTHGLIRRGLTLEKMETLFIRLLFPVYNVDKQWKWNPRKKSKAAARKERERRDMLGKGYRVMKFVLRQVTYTAIIVGGIYAYTKGWIG